MLRKSHFDEVPLKPQRVYQEMNEAFGRDTCYVTTIGLSQIAAAQFLHVYNPRNWINCGQAGPLGWTMPAALGVRKACPERDIVAIRSEEHTSELQSLMRISYAVFCLKKKKIQSHKILERIQIIYIIEK